MHPMTKDNLKSAFSGESQAHMKYLLFADKAEEEGFANVARLLRATAFAERVHASNHLDALDGSRLTLDNLKTAIDGEIFEAEEMYPAYKAVAELQDEKKAVRSTYYALEAEKVHATLYSEAREAVKTGKDLVIGEVYICPVCGHTAVGKLPERCPLCGIEGGRYKRF